MPDERRWTQNPDLRLWAVEVTGPPKNGTWTRNRTIQIGAPDIVTAINAALVEYEDAYETDGAWVVSATHRGGIHLLVVPVSALQVP